MGHSKICKDLKTYYKPNGKETKNGTCELCDRPGLGQEVTPNCGYDDYGGRQEVPFKRCSNNTFNDGAHYFCQPCSSCAQGFTAVQPCSAQADTMCQATAQTTTGSHLTSPNISEIQAISWLVPLTILICGATLALSCWFIYQKRGYRTTSHLRAQSKSLSATQDTNDLKDILSPDILAAPLKCALDDLDVLEELIMLLDPETKGIKNTKHLASLCSFSSTWVTYTYSLKDFKSPLSALLERVRCRHPEWTVGHLALLFRQIEREDAVVALGKLTTDRLQIIDV